MPNPALNTDRQQQRRCWFPPRLRHSGGRLAPRYVAVADDRRLWQDSGNLEV